MCVENMICCVKAGSLTYTDSLHFDRTSASARPGLYESHVTAARASARGAVNRQAAQTRCRAAPYFLTFDNFYDGRSPIAVLVHYIHFTCALPTRVYPFRPGSPQRALHELRKHRKGRRERHTRSERIELLRVRVLLLAGASAARSSASKPLPSAGAALVGLASAAPAAVSYTHLTLPTICSV